MWEYPPHTKAKHDILDYYLGGWYPILSSYNGRVVFIDGFAGRGRYNDGSEGSPILALRKLLSHSFRPRMTSTEFVFAFIERDSANATLLREAIEFLRIDLGGFPPNVKIEVINREFRETAEEIASTLREQKRSMAPTFAFIDPFGYSGLPLETIADLLTSPRSELFVNFMVGHVQRFITREGQEKAITDLFGMPPSDVMATYTSDLKRTEHLRDVYAEQIRAKAGFQFVSHFAMVNASGNVSYYLLHGTNHLKGVELMKDAMWKVDPGAGNRFSDQLAGTQVLFEAMPDFEPLRAALLSAYADGPGTAISEIERFVLVETPYRKAHVRQVLRVMEQNREVTVSRPGRHGFPAGTTVAFG